MICHSMLQLSNWPHRYYHQVKKGGEKLALVLVHRILNIANETPESVRQTLCNSPGDITLIAALAYYKDY